MPLLSDLNLEKKGLNYYEYSMASSTTIVSGYWIIKNKHTEADFKKWFKNTLSINCPYIFFGDKQSIELVKQYRTGPTVYVELNIEDFITYKYYNLIGTHEFHAPSKELQLIWHEKIFLMERALKLNPFDSEWFLWVDAGICTYRNQSPTSDKWPDQIKLKTLPKDKVIFTSSNPYAKIKDGIYYHYISGTYMIHSYLLESYAALYLDTLSDYLTKDPLNWIYTDQVIHTYIFNEYPNLFYCLGQGYGTIIPLLA